MDGNPWALRGDGRKGSRRGAEARRGKIKSHLVLHFLCASAALREINSSGITCIFIAGISERSLGIFLIFYRNLRVHWFCYRKI
jgi:hypothetical protein